jgi:hypothetical protein
MKFLIRTKQNEEKVISGKSRIEIIESVLKTYKKEDLTLFAPCLYEFEYKQAREEYQGWCIQCKEIVNDSVEPDAEAYLCESCDRMMVFGIDIALIMGRFHIVNDEVKIEELH